jgi:RimJ/RimL family protein N-acetyltransferase
MTIHRYRRELADPLAVTAAIQPYVLRTFRSRADVPVLHALLQESYAARGASLGTALMAHICRVFERRGAHALDLKVEAGNQAAIALYEGMGMRRVETVAA